MMFDATIISLGETVTIYGTSSGTDALGNPVSIWDVNQGDEIGIVTPALTEDFKLFAGRIASSDRKLILPSSSNITTGDRVLVDGVWYDAQGTKPDWKIKFKGTTEVFSLLLKRVL